MNRNWRFRLNLTSLTGPSNTRVGTGNGRFFLTKKTINKGLYFLKMFDDFFFRWSLVCEVPRHGTDTGVERPAQRQRSEDGPSLPVSRWADRRVFALFGSSGKAIDFQIDTHNGYEFEFRVHGQIVEQHVDAVRGQLQQRKRLVAVLGLDVSDHGHGQIDGYDGGHREWNVRRRRGRNAGSEGDDDNYWGSSATVPTGRRRVQALVPISVRPPTRPAASRERAPVGSTVGF